MYNMQDEMRQIQRFMGYCLALRERRPAGQQAVFKSLGIGEPALSFVDALRPTILFTFAFNAALIRPHAIGMPRV